MALMTMIELSTKNEITTKDVIKLFSFLTRDTSLTIFVSNTKDVIKLSSFMTRDTSPTIFVSNHHSQIFSEN